MAPKSREHVRGVVTELRAYRGMSSVDRRVRIRRHHAVVVLPRGRQSSGPSSVHACAGSSTTIASALGISLAVVSSIAASTIAPTVAVLATRLLTVARCGAVMW